MAACVRVWVCVCQYVREMENVFLPDMRPLTTVGVSIVAACLPLALSQALSISLSLSVDSPFVYVCYWDNNP